MAKKYAGLDAFRTFLDNLKALFATKTEVSNKADKTHTHDDRYYTETEIDSKVSTINTSIDDIVNGATTVAKATKATSADSATTAASATKATQDGNNNIIASTYETKTDAATKLGEAKFYTDSKTANLASTTVVDNKISTHNTSTSAHDDIRVLITDLTEKLNNFLDVDDTTTDQLSEVITLIDNNKGTLESLTTSKVNVSDIVDNLTTANASKVLSANQGVVIKNLINTLQSGLDNHTHTVSDITDLTVSATELNYVDGVTSAIQTQLNAKAPNSHASTEATYGIGTSSNYGHVKLTDSTNNNNGAFTGVAATPKAVKSAYDLANTAKTNAATAQSTADVAKTNAATAQSKADSAYTLAESKVDSLSDLGITATATELNTLDGITATVTELNYMDGVTANVQTQLNNKASSSHTHTISEVTNLQTTLDNKASKDVATQTSAGLLSTEDKIQLDYGGVPMVTATSTDGVTYTATVDGVTTLKSSMIVSIIPDTTSTTTSPKLNVNNLGAKTIRMPIAYNTSLTAAGPIAGWLVANKPITVQWNGTYWVTTGFSRPASQYLYGAVPVENGGTGATDVATARANLGAASVTSYNVSIPVSWTEDSTNGGYYQTVAVSGILSTDEPIVDIVLGSDIAANDTYLDAWSLITRITTSDDSITLYANKEAPTSEFNIKMKVVR